MVPTLTLNLLLTLATVTSSQQYTNYSDLNCWTGHGGVNIDNSTTAPAGLNLAQCKARCDADPSCFCVVLVTSTQKCYKRSLCLPKKCMPTSGMDVYTKPGAPSPPPTPNPTPIPRPPSTSRNVLYIVFGKKKTRRKGLLSVQNACRCLI